MPAPHPAAEPGKPLREVAADEIDRFRREIIERTGDPRAADSIDV